MVLICSNGGKTIGKPLIRYQCYPLLPGDLHCLHHCPLPGSDLHFSEVPNQESSGEQAPAWCQETDAVLLAFIPWHNVCLDWILDPQLCGEGQVGKGKADLG